MKPRPIIVPIGPSIAYVPLTRGMFALIDDVDIPLAEGRNWSAFCNGVTFYARHNKWKNGKWSTVFLHRKIIDCSDDRQGDHVNGNTLDCRRCNLREATPTQNNWNAGLRKDNKHGIKGCSQIPSGRWQARIRINKRLIHLGTYDTAEEAGAVYLRRAENEFGQFVRRS